jgi:hypothetical protein
VVEPVELAGNVLGLRESGEEAQFDGFVFEFGLGQSKG